MCGRFDFHGEAIDIESAFGVSIAQLDLPVSYNIAPTDGAPVLWTPQASDTVCAPMRFGWKRRGGGMLVNARADSVMSNVFYRQAVRMRRCAVVAQGFFEWDKVGKRKQPYYVHRPDKALLAFAGLWQPSDTPDVPPAFVIITTEANGLIAPMHERMPVVLDPEGARAWLNADAEDKGLLEHLLSPCADDALSMRAVSMVVNKADSDGPECIAGVAG